MTATGAPDFDERFDDLARLAHRVAYRILGQRQEAEDVAQEALARAFVRWRRIGGHADAWVTRVATNLALGLLRRRRTQPLTEAEPGAVDAVASDRLELVQMIEGLPRRQREVVVLRYLADLSEADVAERLGVSRGSVKRHAHRATRALEPVMKERLAIEGEC